MSPCGLSPVAGQLGMLDAKPPWAHSQPFPWVLHGYLPGTPNGDETGPALLSRAIYRSAARHRTVSTSGLADAQRWVPVGRWHVHGEPDAQILFSNVARNASLPERFCPDWYARRTRPLPDGSPARSKRRARMVHGCATPTTGAGPHEHRRQVSSAPVARLGAPGGRRRSTDPG